jgi:hypothetical protein
MNGDDSPIILQHRRMWQLQQLLMHRIIIFMRHMYIWPFLARVWFNIQSCPRIHWFGIRGFPRPEKKLENYRHKRFISFETSAKRQPAVTWWNPAAQTCSVLDSSSFVPVPKLKVRIPYFHTYEREKVHCKYTMQCRVHFIITLFNVGNILLCVIYQLNFTVFMYVTRISRYN